MNQVFPDRLNPALGDHLKSEGLAQVEGSNTAWLDAMRHEARRICAEKGWVSADCLRGLAVYLPDPSSPNVWGAIFKEKDWVPVGHAKSAFATNHSRQIRRWRWTGAFDCPARPPLTEPPGFQGDLFSSPPPGPAPAEEDRRASLLKAAVRLLESACTDARAGQLVDEINEELSATHR